MIGSFLFKNKLDRDKKQQIKLDESNNFLIEAAIATADAAQALTNVLQSKVQKELAKSEPASRILSDSLIICDMNGHIQYTNASSERIFSHNLINHSISEIFSSKEEKIIHPYKLFELLNDISWQHVIREDVLYGVNKNTGISFSIEPKIEKIDWQDGTSSMMILIRDSEIYDRLQYQDGNLDSYDSMFNGAVDGIFVIQNSIIIAANVGIKKLFNYEINELLNRPITTVFSEADCKFLQPSNNTDNPYQLIIAGIKENGDTIDLVVTSTSLTWNQQDANIVTMREVSDLKRLEELSNLRDNGVDMIVCFNKDFKITFSNNVFASFYGLKRSDITGKNLKDVITHEEYVVLLKNASKISKMSPSFRSQIKKIGDDGKVHIIDWIWRAIYSPDGEIIEYQRTGRDLSEVLQDLISFGYF